jgi:hypothetical protein
VPQSHHGQQDSLKTYTNGEFIKYNKQNPKIKKWDTVLGKAVIWYKAT